MMENGDIISAAIALVAVVISLVSLQRTRRIQERALELQEEMAALSKLQREELERILAEKEHAERKVAEEEAERVLAQEKWRLRGRITVATGLFRGAPGFNVRNWSEVPMKNIDIQLVAGVAAPLFESVLREKFPINHLKPGETVVIETEAIPPNCKILVSWETSIGKFQSTEELYESVHLR